MSALDVAVLGAAMLAAGTLIGSALRKAIERRLLQRLPEAWRDAHARLTQRIVSRKILRIPGLSLVDPLKPWAAAEALALLVLLLGISVERSAMGVFRTLPASLFLGACIAWISFRSASREALRSVQRDLPVACLLLSLLMESGMGTSSALQETASSLPAGPLARELGALVHGRALGLSRAESIERSGKRVPLEDYHLFLNHILQGERLGIGLSRSLRGMATKMLENQDFRAETIAQRAAVKLLFPLICFIFPAVFLIILSPVILGIWKYLPGGTP